MVPFPVDSMNDSRDTLYSKTRPAPASFTFDEAVASVFPDMIRRSVPGYSTIIAMTGVLAGRHATAGSNLYDLGCSLGASTLAMRSQLRQTGCTIHGVDNSPAMLKRCAEAIAADDHSTAVRLHAGDVTEHPISDASVVVLNFTLQFIEPDRRDPLLGAIQRGLNPGGILMLSEKITFADARQDQRNRELHEDFKRSQGYSELEIAGKRTALERRLIAETLPQHEERLGRAGFSRCDIWFRCCNFASIIAVK